MQKKMEIELSDFGLYPPANEHRQIQHRRADELWQACIEFGLLL